MLVENHRDGDLWEVIYRQIVPEHANTSIAGLPMSVSGKAKKFAS